MNEILDSLGEGAFTVDKGARITFVNRAGRKVPGVKREEDVGGDIEKRLGTRGAINAEKEKFLGFTKGGWFRLTAETSSSGCPQ